VGYGSDLISNLLLARFLNGCEIYVLIMNEWRFSLEESHLAPSPLDRRARFANLGTNSEIADLGHSGNGRVASHQA